MSQGDFTAGHSFSLLLLSCFSLSSPNQTLGFDNRTFFFVIFNFTSVYIFIFVPGRFHNRAFFFFFSILCMSLSSPNQTLSHGNLTLGLFETEKLDPQHKFCEYFFKEISRKKVWNVFAFNETILKASSYLMNAECSFK